MDSRNGKKRKRHEFKQELDIKIEGKLHHNLKEVKKAAKKAKTFEIQKLVKKLKDLRLSVKAGTSSAVSEVEQELEFLKRLNHDPIATTALKTKINKVRMLRDNELVQAAITKELISEATPVTPGAPPAKVQSRLLSSKILALEIAAVVEDLKRILQPKAEVIEEANGLAITGNEPTAKRPKILTKSVNTEVNLATTSETLRRLKDGESEAETEDQDEDEDGDDAGWESGTVTGVDSANEDGLDPTSGSTDNESEDDSARQADDDNSGSHHASRSRQALPTNTPAKSTGLRSTFLPSLAVGFTRGESDDSDLSESEVKAADIDIKKNRRGQRARRAIWEKKYGKNANHKMKEREPGIRSKPVEYHMGRQATTQHYNNLSNKISNPKAGSGGWQPVSSQPGIGNHKEGHLGGEMLHPSWEAKRRMKEKERATIVPSQGKKIKFS